MKWVKISGAGNSFYISDNFSTSHEGDRSALAQKICNQFTNAPVDGLIILEKNSTYDFAWDFYNRDGSSAEMCGNAARCVFLYFQKFIKKKSQISFLSTSGPISVREADHQRMAVEMPIIKEYKEENGVYFLNTGVPHIVIEKEPSREEALKYRPQPAPRGSNVTFLNKNNAVTFERGVEDFTLSCGTGAVAAAAVLFLNNKTQNNIIKMPGGELEVEINNLQNPPKLIGSAIYEYELEI